MLYLKLSKFFIWLSPLAIFFFGIHIHGFGKWLILPFWKTKMGTSMYVNFFLYYLLVLPGILHYLAVRKSTLFRCAHCDDLNIKYMKGKISEGYWKHRNVDLSRDRRFNKNFKIQEFIAEFECIMCTAITEFKSFPTHNPHRASKIYKKTLLKKGYGPNLGTEYKSEN